MFKLWCFFLKAQKSYYNNSLVENFKTNLVFIKFSNSNNGKNLFTAFISETDLSGIIETITNTQNPRCAGPLSIFDVLQKP